MQGGWIQVTLLLLAGWLPFRSAAAQTAFDGVLLVRTTVSGRQDTTVQTTRGSRARFDYICDLVRSCSTVVESDSHVTRMIEHDYKAYLTITRADTRQLRELGTILKPMPESTPRMAGLGNLEGLRYKKTGKTARVAGVPCRIWVGRRPGADREDVSEACLGTSAIGFHVELLIDALMADTDTSAAAEDTDLPRQALGSGLLKLSVVKDGRPTTLEVISVTPTVVDDSVFATPAGYTEVRMADLLQRVQAWLDDARFRRLDLTPRFGLALNYPVTDDPRTSQIPALDSCAWQRIRPGDEQGEGEVRYSVTAEGVPDTATLTVVRLSRADPESFLEAARHVVGSCRFGPRTADSNAVPTLVRQRISFLKGDEDDSPDSRIYREGASAYLVPAAHLKCAPEIRDSGVWKVDMVIGRDGRPEPGTISAVNVTTHANLRAAPLVFAGCVFTPARYQGRPVRQAITFSVRVKDRATQAAGPPATFAVSELVLGQHIAADKRVLSPTVSFGSRDTIYASVATTGSAVRTTLAAKWTFEDGQTVKEDSLTIASTGPTVTEFHIVKPSGWPVGKYTVRIAVDGAPVATKDFEVRDE